METWRMFRPRSGVWGPRCPVDPHRTRVGFGSLVYPIKSLGGRPLFVWTLTHPYSRPLGGVAGTTRDGNLVPLFLPARTSTL